MHKKSISDPDSSSFPRSTRTLQSKRREERSAVPHLRDILNTVVKHKSVAVGREQKRDVKGHGIVERLLHAGGDAVARGTGDGADTHEAGPKSDRPDGISMKNDGIQKTR